MYYGLSSIYFGNVVVANNPEYVQLCVGDLSMSTARSYESYETIESATQIKKLNRKILTEIETTIDIDLAMIDVPVLQLLFPLASTSSFLAANGANFIKPGEPYLAAANDVFIKPNGEILNLPPSGVNSNAFTIIQTTYSTLEEAISFDEAQSSRQFAATLVGTEGNLYLNCERVLITSYPNLATQSTSYRLSLKCLVQPIIMRILI